MAFKNRVVVHYLDGRVSKGFTFDFLPNKDSFHLVDAEDERKVVAVPVKDLKAVFFVKTFAGNKGHRSGPPARWGRASGQRLKVTFRDGEVVYGSTTAYTPGRRGFFIVPADEMENNDRAYVFADSTVSVEVLSPTDREATASAGRAR